MPIVLTTYDGAPRCVLKLPEPSQAISTPNVIERIYVIRHLRPGVEHMMPLDIHNVYFRRDAPDRIIADVPPCSPKRRLSVTMSAHSLDVRLDVPLIEERPAVEHVVARDARVAERRREEVVPARLVDADRLLAPADRRFECDVGDALGLSARDHHALLKRLVDWPPVEAVWHEAVAAAERIELGGVVRGDYLRGAAHVDVASGLGEARRVAGDGVLHGGRDARG